MECVALALTQKGFASMVVHFAWEVCFNGGLLCMVCIHNSCFFFLFLPLSTPTQKEENKTKEEKLTLLWALGV
jgi:hypothetical protein